MHRPLKKLGLALSGGGFRGCLYHLGLVRFLRDAGILSQVSHITSVSGGSIIAAHLVLNWDRYNGSPGEFDDAASELLSFVRLDIRNRIARRFGLALPLRWPRRLLGYSNRKLTLTGLLEYHYEKHLYGDTSLFQLPERPLLHILATNLSEGCLCSFNRNGLLMVRRQPGHTFRIDHIHAGLATVSMAVTASSAFPGFFPPVELTGSDVGASAGEFNRQAYTDGGVFDNLGVRMFRCLQRPLLVEHPVSRDDFVDLQGALQALRQAGKSNEETPLRRVGQVLMAAGSRREPLRVTNVGKSSTVLLALLEAGGADNEDLVISNLSDVMRMYPFYHDPLFAGLKPVDPDANAFLHAARVGGGMLDVGDRVWLNRHLLEAAFRQATGQPCFRRLDSVLDGVLVSDVGKRIHVQANRRAGGLIRTSMRATDIVMDRVWQLENETFRHTPGFVFAPMTDVITLDEDPTALHPEVQRKVAGIRTDLDRFSTLEISSLVRHGYCVGRKSCRNHPNLFGADIPNNPPWNPVPAPPGAAACAPTASRLIGPSKAPAADTVVARALQASAVRRIWSALLDRRDWASYVYVPLLIPILCLLPYMVIRSYQRSYQLNHLVESLAQGSPDLEYMSHLLDNGPEKPWAGEPFEEVPKVADSDFAGFQIFQDSRIIDLRNWKVSTSEAYDPSSVAYVHRRMKVLKAADHAGNNLFNVNFVAIDPKTVMRFPTQQLRPKLTMSKLENSAPGETRRRWQATYDFQHVPAGEFVDLITEHLSPGRYLQSGDHGTAMDFLIQAPTAELSLWILMPEGKQYSQFRLLRHETESPEKIEAVKPVTEYLADDFRIIAFKLLALQPGYTYEISWSYK